MAAFRPKIVFFDIDDTLYHKSADVIPDSALNALNALHEQGILTAIATGRSPAAFPKCVKDAIARFEMDVIVSINGQYCTYQGEVRVAHPIPKPDLQRIIALCAEKDWAYMCATAEGMMVSRDDDVVHGALWDIGEYVVNPDVWQKDPVYQMNVQCGGR